TAAAGSPRPVIARRAAPAYIWRHTQSFLAVPRTPAMPSYTQANRFMSAATPLGPDKLLLERLSGTESLSTPFELELDLLGTTDFEFSFDQVLGESVTVTVQLPDGSVRYFNGIVSRFAEGDRVPGPGGANEFVRYTATVVPKLWLLGRRTGSRIFQQVGIPD